MSCRSSDSMDSTISEGTFSIHPGKASSANINTPVMRYEAPMTRMLLLLGRLCFMDLRERTLKFRRDRLTLVLNRLRFGLRGLIVLCIDGFVNIRQRCCQTIYVRFDSFKCGSILSHRGLCHKNLSRRHG